MSTLEGAPRSPGSLSLSEATVTAPRICLSMIVRDESAVIERCLTAALPLLDAAVICDTGSTDATAALAQALFAARRIPVEVCHHQWRDFGANRTAAIGEARRVVAALGWPLAQTFWLFLDADLEVVLDAPFDRASLAADAIALRQRSGPLSCWNLRLARASLEWSAIGRTHERYTCPTEPPVTRLSSLWIRDHGDGGSKAAKVSRDIAWLSEQLDETPDDPRTLFYLAQSYRAGGDPLKALLLYRRRTAIPVHPEERWYSTLSMAQILGDAGHVEAATAALMEAAALDPGRAEPLYELSRLHLRHGRRDEAIAFAEQGQAKPVPVDRSHFVHDDVYEYKLDLQLAEAAAGVASHAERGVGACERVALSRKAPPAAVDEARRIAVRYARPIGGMEFLPLQPALPAPYRPCNPSIVRTADGYVVVCRAVNYEQRRLHYRSLDGDGVYRTRNVLMRMDEAFQVQEEVELTIDEAPSRQALVRGLEDCRLVASGDDLFLTCATVDRHPSGLVHQSICRIDPRGRVLAHRPLVGPLDGSPQKNWLPFVTDAGALHALHSYDPLTVLRLSSDTGTYSVAGQMPSRANAGGWRGSAGPLAWPAVLPDRRGRQIVLVHEAVRRQAADSVWERVYLHRFVEYDTDFRLTRVSRPFTFAHNGVEFACGMAPTHDGLALIVAVGVEDREAYLGRIAFARIDVLLDATRMA